MELMLSTKLLKIIEIQYNQMNLLDHFGFESHWKKNKHKFTGCVSRIIGTNFICIPIQECKLLSHSVGQFSKACMYAFTIWYFYPFLFVISSIDLWYLEPEEISPLITFVASDSSNDFK